MLEWLVDIVYQYQNSGGMEMNSFSIPNSVSYSVRSVNLSLWIFSVFFGDLKSILQITDEISVCALEITVLQEDRLYLVNTVWENWGLRPSKVKNKWTERIGHNNVTIALVKSPSVHYDDTFKSACVPLRDKKCTCCDVVLSGI